MKRIFFAILAACLGISLNSCIISRSTPYSHSHEESSHGIYDGYIFSDGDFYYRMTDDCSYTVELVKEQGRWASTYDDEFLEIPSSVSHEGNTYQVTSIGDSAFFLCNDLKTIVIPQSIRSIHKAAFSNCRKLEYLIIPNSVNYIGTEAFAWCSSLKNINLPSALTNISDGAFYGCESLEQISLPSALTNISDHAFYRCKSLSFITIPKGVENIGKHAFNRCKSLAKVTLPPTLTNIGDYAFYGCKSLSIITIPKGVENIGSSAFNRCESLREINIPESVTNIGPWAFFKTGIIKNFEYIDDDAIYVDNCLIQVLKSKKGEMDINPDTRLIAGSAFAYANSITSVYIPASVERIGEYLFNKCSSLQYVEVDEQNKVYHSNDCNAIIETTSRTVIAGCKNTKLSDHDRIVAIGAGAFAGLDFEYFRIPETVQRIGSCAFVSCKNLKQITIPASVNKIGDNMFQDCSSLS